MKVKTEQATYTEAQVAELIAKAIRQDREFCAQVLRSLPLTMSDVKQGWIENPGSLQRTLEQALTPPDNKASETELSSLRNLDIIPLSIPAQQECTVAHCFTNKKVFVYRDTEFNHLLPATLSASTEVSVSGRELTEITTEGEIATVGKPFTNLTQIEDLILRTENGENTGLITNGYSNIFFLAVGSSVFTVRTDRRDDGWGVSLCRFRARHRWVGEHRFFSLAT